MSHAFHRTRPDGCPSDLALDRLLSEELAQAEGETLRAHIERCQRCQARHDELSADRDAFHAQPPGWLPPLPQQDKTAPAEHEVPPDNVRRLSFGSVGATLAVAAVAAAALLMLRPAEDTETTTGGTRVKGGAAAIRLSYHVRRNDGRVEPGVPDGKLAPGDRVRFSVGTAEDGFVAVLSRDGAASVSVYHGAGDKLAAHAAGPERPLDSAVVLDEVLGTERIVAIYCPRAEPLAPLRELLKRDGTRLRLPEGCARADTHWIKVEEAR